MARASRDAVTDAITIDEPKSAPRLESVEEIRQAIAFQHKPTAPDQVGTAAHTPFIPTHRPPIAVLTILDDGREDGEVVRLRSDRCVLGRTEGDVIISHDTMMSGRHAEIAQPDQGRHRWFLRDLSSTNGTFVRISVAPLQAGQEILIGDHRYQFDLTPIPTLVQLNPQGEGPRYPLTPAENWIGHDASQCTVVLANDPLVSSRHARLFRDAEGCWQLENAGAFNGTWLRVHTIELEDFCAFQLGEQRFLLRILG